MVVSKLLIFFVSVPLFGLDYSWLVHLPSVCRPLHTYHSGVNAVQQEEDFCAVTRTQPWRASTCGIDLTEEAVNTPSWYYNAAFVLFAPSSPSYDVFLSLYYCVDIVILLCFDVIDKVFEKCSVCIFHRYTSLISSPSSSVSMQFVMMSRNSSGIMKMPSIRWIWKPASELDRNWIGRRPTLVCLLALIFLYCNWNDKLAIGAEIFFPILITLHSLLCK